MRIILHISLRMSNNLLSYVIIIMYMVDNYLPICSMEPKKHYVNKENLVFWKKKTFCLEILTFHGKVLCLFVGQGIRLNLNINIKLLTIKLQSQWISFLTALALRGFEPRISGINGHITRNRNIYYIYSII